MSLDARIRWALRGSTLVTLALALAMLFATWSIGDADASTLRLWQTSLTVGLALSLLVIAILTRWLRESILGPIQDLLRIIERSTAGGAHSRPGGVAGTLGEGVATLRRVLAEREEALARLEIVSRRDPLTGLGNRLSFDGSLPAALHAAAESGGEVALISIDVDKFKEVNDTLGHAAGDEVLRRIAALLQDACGDDEVSRIGGDEFAIIQTGKEQPANAQALVGQLMAAVGDGRVGDDIPIGLSIGAAIYPRDGDDDQVLRHHADVALYRAKHDGRSKARFFGMLEASGPEAVPDIAGASSLAIDLPGGIRAGELVLAYQPKLHARTGLVTSAEALVRWNHPTRGRVQPDDFITIAEKTGQIRALTEWVLWQTIADQAWLNSQGRPVDLFVNISALLLSDADFADTLLKIVAGRTGVIGLEITETAIIDDPELTLSHLRRFVDAGLKIAIDDYGAGWSSLSYLKQLPAHELKIDRAFITDISRSHRDPLLVRSTIDLAHALGMEVTAEGVDTSAALALLKVMGCDMIQGFLVSRPLPLHGLATFLADEQRVSHLDQLPIRFGTGPDGEAGERGVNVVP